MDDRLQTGLAVLHANHLEDLRELVVQWIKAHPLHPLESEVLLVQSNGMAQWLKLALAADEALGVAACLEAVMPQRFLWSLYRQVLGEQLVPRTSPFDKAPLTWRLHRLLPSLLDQPEFAPLARFLAADDDGRRRYQLALKLADLFDQYQVYRADWLEDWEAGHERLRLPIGDGFGETALPEGQRWQSALWRHIIADLPEAERHTSRAQIHTRALAALQAGEIPAGLPRRVVVFGISSLPRQVLEALAALAEHTHVLLFVNNPCAHYWGDICVGRDLLRRQLRHRHPDKLGLQQLTPEALHLQVNPLLAAWGKQGRDYMALLEEFDQPESYRATLGRIDLFRDWVEPEESMAAPLLRQVQQGILQLEPAPQPPRPLTTGDRSIDFHIAHSRQREVEILHDQLLQRFAEAAAAGRPLAPRDVMVMVPDIGDYAAHIEAVFGAIDRRDPRYLPYTLADRQERGYNPVLQTIERLLQLPLWRFTSADLLALLEVPALRRRLGLVEADLPLLQRWIEGSGIRWGIDAAQRASLELPAGLQQNSWRFGLERMLLGYTNGDSPSPWGAEPYGEIGGLDAALLGPLMELVDRLEHYGQLLAQPATVLQWQERLSQLLQDLFLAEEEQELLTLSRVEQALEQWVEQCAQAQLSEPLHLPVVRDALLALLDAGGLSQRFLAGAINFGTLMPMRAIPFRQVCLLGMHDGAYPRSHPPQDFDLMAQHYRPGDRSRREDDRYLFLEALLAAREGLYISWVGRRIQDNSTCPPSVLVAQLRDHLAQGWCGEGGAPLLEQLTTEHPLQPFSPRYFTVEGGLRSYAREWRALHDEVAALPEVDLQPLQEWPEPLTPEHLQRLLRHPVRTFFNQRLKVFFDEADSAALNDEPFTLDGLERYQLGEELLQALIREPHAPALERQIDRIRASGCLPLAAFAERPLGQLRHDVERAWENRQGLLSESDPLDKPLAIELTVQLASQSVPLQGWLGDCHQRTDGQLLRVLSAANNLLSGKDPKYHRLLGLWVEHLCGCAAGYRLRSQISGADTVFGFEPLSRLEARERLTTLVDSWLAAQCQPLPVACQTGITLLLKGADKARGVYQSSSAQQRGEGEDAYLARCYPDFDQLLAADPEGEWARRLYQPMLDALQRRDQGDLS